MTPPTVTPGAHSHVHTSIFPRQVDKRDILIPYGCSPGRTTVFATSPHSSNGQEEQSLQWVGFVSVMSSQVIVFARGGVFENWHERYRVPYVAYIRSSKFGSDWAGWPNQRTGILCGGRRSTMLLTDTLEGKQGHKALVAPFVIPI